MPVVSAASRNVRTLSSRLFMRKLFRHLKWRRLSKAGRGAFGRVVVWTKSALKKRLIHPSLNYTARTSTIGFVAVFKLIPFQNKLTALIFLGSGGATYLPATSRFRMLTFMRIRGRYFKAHKALALPRAIMGLLTHVKLLSKVSLLELYPGQGVQYVRSGGVCARLTRVNLRNYTGVVQLPSGVKKSFSLYSLASFGPVALKAKRRVRNTRSGYWRTFGVKSIVRGVARNPVDHPHGGRTKAIKYPRTPWGKTTKFK